MNINHKTGRLRCALCRRGLLATYNVYDVPRDEFGAWGEPVLYSSVTGYLFVKNTRSAADTLEIAGELTGCADGVCKLIAFSPECKISDLVEVDGVFYRIVRRRALDSICAVLELEVYPYEYEHQT